MVSEDDEYFYIPQKHSLLTMFGTRSFALLFLNQVWKFNLSSPKDLQTRRRSRICSNFAVHARPVVHQTNHARPPWVEKILELRGPHNPNQISSYPTSFASARTRAANGPMMMGHVSQAWPDLRRSGERRYHNHYQNRQRIFTRLEHIRVGEIMVPAPSWSVPSKGPPLSWNPYGKPLGILSYLPSVLYLLPTALLICRPSGLGCFKGWKCFRTKVSLLTNMYCLIHSTREREIVQDVEAGMPRDWIGFVAHQGNVEYVQRSSEAHTYAVHWA